MTEWQQAPWQFLVMSGFATHTIAFFIATFMLLLGVDKNGVRRLYHFLEVTVSKEPMVQVGFILTAFVISYASLNYLPYEQVPVWVQLPLIWLVFPVAMVFGWLSWLALLRNERIQRSGKPMREIESPGAFVLFIILISYFVFMPDVGNPDYLAGKRRYLHDTFGIPMYDLDPNHPLHIAMVDVKGGTFRMGADEENEGVEVTLSDYQIGKYEVTQAQFEAVMGYNPSSFKDCSNCPVERVSWYDAILYCNTLSEMKGLEPAYLVDSTQIDTSIQNPYDNFKWRITFQEGADGYVLPTEAQWEFAARGGAKGGGYLYAGSDSLEEVGWFWKNSGDSLLTGEWDVKYIQDSTYNLRTHPIGEKTPNSLGVYDMSGNVFEWCWDWADSYPAGPLRNPTGADTGSYRVLRGGSWNDFASYCRVAARYRSVPADRNGRVGFRLSRDGLP